ncbi:GD14931 [Drosophila simulans]|uniref:GD14931 n=1 Tax=Drosophila simulans TaxID=7240 RepID=B4QJM7_DROSI|nr:GD14931 [Drosophila simulans]
MSSYTAAQYYKTTNMITSNEIYCLQLTTGDFYLRSAINDQQSTLTQKAEQQQS